MKKIFITRFFVLFMLLSASTLSYAQIEQQELTATAETFLKKNLKKSSQQLQIKSIKDIKHENNLYAHVIELKPYGFIVLSSSKKQYPIIAFSETDNFDFEASPDNIFLSFLINDMQHQLECIAENEAKSKEKIDKNIETWNKFVSGTTVTQKTTVQYGPLLPDIWGGVNCYNQDSVMVYVGNHYTPSHYSPGCVATSFSQILNYYEWPIRGTGSHTNYDNIGNSESTNYANFATTTYDWDNMLDEYQYKASTTIQQQAMGLLVYQCGTALDMNYEDYGSTSHISRAPDALVNYFRMHGHYEDDRWSDFWPRLNENIEDGLPVHLGIEAYNGVGHAIVCDGYQYDDPNHKYYHLNMGWWGACNSWYLIQEDWYGCGYNQVTGGVFDIHPNPMFTETTLSDKSTSFTLNWTVSAKLNWESFELEQSYNGGAWTIVSSAITSTSYNMSVVDAGGYQYRVRAKINGTYYYDSYSEDITVAVKNEGDITILDFDGDDSFFTYDNSSNSLDVSNTWTIETWVNIDNHSNGTYPVIIDRRTAFSLYLVDVTNGDYGVRFVARSSTGSIIASVRSDVSDQYLYYGDWIHIAVSHGNNSTTMFVNGTEVESSTDLDFNLTSTSYALNVGARYWRRYERFIDGKIDGICISESQKYTSNFAPERFDLFDVTTDIRLLLKMDEGSGSILTDASENFDAVMLRNSPNDASWMFESLAKSQENEKQQITIEENKVQFSVYPNPTSYNVYCDLSGFSENVHIKIIDLTGKTVYKKDFHSANNTTLHVENLPNGIYSVVAYDGNTIRTTKLLITK